MAIDKDHIPYHVFSRAVDGKPIFRRKDDAHHFLFQMYAENHGSPAANVRRKDIQKAVEKLLVGEETSKEFYVEKHEPLVHFLSFVQTVNHYHFLLLPNAEKGISLYMKKLNIAFAKYFNLKYSRRGTLFESRYKSVPIETEAQLDAIIRYINVKNPLDVYQPGWRERGLRNEEEGWDFLHSYAYSSFPDIFGGRNSRFLAPKSIRSQFLDRAAIYGKKSYDEFLKQPMRTIGFGEVLLDEQSCSTS